LVVDNYDSFVFNLVQYLGQLGVDAQVWRNDDARLADEAGIAAEFDGVLLSPGPGTPERAGASIPLVRACAAAATPLLGVCLGHQAIGVAFGGTVDRAPELLHGKTSTVYHTNDGVLQGLPNPFTATRYHSLTILPETVPAELEVTGRTKSGVIMAVRHVELPIHGVQFHPESILTEGGHRMLANWLGYCGQAPEETLVHRLEQEVADTVRHALGGQERSDRGIGTGGQERSDRGIGTGGPERPLPVTTQS
jgi:para-aminobenzoate synthetase component 2